MTLGQWNGYTWINYKTFLSCDIESCSVFNLELFMCSLSCRKVLQNIQRKTRIFCIIYLATKPVILFFHFLCETIWFRAIFNQHVCDLFIFWKEIDWFFICLIWFRDSKFLPSCGVGVQSRTLYPLLSKWLTFAPFFINNSTAFRWPERIERCILSKQKHTQPKAPIVPNHKLIFYLTTFFLAAFQNI